MRVGVKMLVATGAAALLLACAPRNRAPEIPPRGVPPPQQPIADRWQIDSSQSLLTVRVHRAGPMASIGHNHVIALRDPAGWIERPDRPAATRLLLRLALASFSVDEPQLRAQAGDEFSAVVPDDARQGTKNNMLGEKLLDVKAYPEILVRSTAVRRAATGYRADLMVDLKGGEYPLRDLPVDVTIDGPLLRASGAVTLRHGDLGLVPFSVMFGALRVADEMQIDYLIVARAPTREPTGYDP
ncbi:MAG: YceI family protein [Steroidobacteraceae bacterium]